MHGNKHQFGANIPSPPTKKTNASIQTSLEHLLSLGVI